LPDPHAYIRTPTYKQPETEYEAIREKSANQKRDIEKALTKFLAKTAKGMSSVYHVWLFLIILTHIYFRNTQSV
jgi:hypothetical protein